MDTKEICLTIELSGRAIQQILEGDIHPLYPQKRATDSYTKQFIKGSEEYENANTGFDYTYPQRLFDRPLCVYYEGGKCCANSCDMEECEEGVCYMDQMKRIAENFNEFDRRLQAVTWDYQQDLVTDKSVPCLQNIHVRYLGNGTYEIHLHWRSRDLFKAWQLNKVGIIRSIDLYIKKYSNTEFRCVRVIDHIDMAHVYQSGWDAPFL